MIRRLAVAALALTAVPAVAQNTPPATVVVAFDREGVRPLIVEGLANKQSGRALEANDPVRIASISKLIMALAALRLMDEGKLDLDRDVSDYLGWKLRSPHHPDAPVTLRHLLMHRAGLSDAGGYVIPLGESLEAKLADPAAWRKTGRPGEAAFEYANLGSPIVATVLEAASGERYDRLVERLVFAPLGVKACFNWIGCGPEMEARAVTLYRHAGEVAADGADSLPPACTIPVAQGVECSLDAYVPGTNASIFSPQGGVRIGMMDLGKIGQALVRGGEADFLKSRTLELFVISPVQGRTEAQQLFCHYGLGLQMIEWFDDPCDDTLFDSGRPWLGHPGEAYGLLSGLWYEPSRGQGFVYFTTESPPPAGGEDTGNFTPRERALMARALDMMAERAR
ncbi:serine hydrolase domain-containing protein [Erythrobacter tepidarius]|uniref:serine hydrolase domain-containing protein n=1 Tax=Erythrobacter tepidarius TaxID=60454 RepID=UPI001FECADBD|nr:serine hydrolase domain-containing protein [Erythrobacter tepidarius]